jgi:hypothetical protein
MRLKIFGPAALAAMALMAFTASSATATTLEVKGTKQTSTVTWIWSFAGVGLLFEDTSGLVLNTCTASTAEGKDSTATTGTTVSGPVSSLTFSSCTEGSITVDAAGSISIENISGTTNGTVRSIGMKFTTPSPLGTLTCVTAASPGTDIGTLTGVASGKAKVDINAALNCGIITARWVDVYVLTGPEGLGVTS